MIVWYELVDFHSFLSFSNIFLDLQLGRLKIDPSCGLNADGKYEKLCAFSTRSWSIFKAETMELVWDSGSDVEMVLKAKHPAIFNSDGADPGDKQSDEFDKRSDDKGAEVESLAIGVIDGVTLVFVGLERASVVLVYDASDPTSPKYHSSLRLGAEDKVPAALAVIACIVLSFRMFCMVSGCKGALMCSWNAGGVG